MRPNRLSERLKTKLDSFGFDALIHGVSTLPEEKPADTALLRVSVETADAAKTPAAKAGQGTALEEPVRHLTDTPEIDLNGGSGGPSPLLSAPVLQAIQELTAEDDASPGPRNHPFTPGGAPQRAGQLGLALDGLGCQLRQEAGRMAAALRQRDADAAGYHLSHVNQVLELLRSIDPQGNAARDLALADAPPAGRPWPLTAWTVAEFAASPFSALLPSDCGDGFVREMLYAAWGVSIGPVEP